jgi:putative ABC transport system substrate-binding protein
MRRRAFIAGISSAALLAPCASLAQQHEAVRKIAMLLPLGPGDPEGRRRLDAVREGLRQLGWSEDRNLSIEVSWLGNDPEGSAQQRAEELVAHKPEVIFASTTPGLLAVTKATATIPIVFAAVADPVGSGIVKNLAHPGGNVTGFSYLEPTMVGKWLELLREMAPATRQAIYVYAHQTGPFGRAGFLQAFEASSQAMGFAPSNVPVLGLADIDKALETAAESADSGLIMASDAFLLLHRQEIAAMAARYHLPAVYWSREWVVSGGLICYGPVIIDSYRRAPIYVDRILRGASPSELPVQEPTAFELVVNRKTAKALHLDIPPSILARADEVIE